MSVIGTEPLAEQRAAAVRAANGRPARPLAGPGGVRALTAVTTPVAATLASPQTAAKPPANSIEAVLASAERSPQQRLQLKATRIRQQIIELSDLVEAEAETREIEARVQKLRDDLAAAETELRAHRRPAVASSSTSGSTREISRAVRAWAKTNEIKVNAHGRVPETLVEQWRDATGGTL